MRRVVIAFCQIIFFHVDETRKLCLYQIYQWLEEPGRFPSSDLWQIFLQNPAFLYQKSLLRSSSKSSPKLDTISSTTLPELNMDQGHFNSKSIKWFQNFSKCQYFFGLQNKIKNYIKLWSFQKLKIFFLSLKFFSLYKCFQTKVFSLLIFFENSREVLFLVKFFQIPTFFATINFSKLQENFLSVKILLNVAIFKSIHFF